MIGAAAELTLGGGFGLERRVEVGGPRVLEQPLGGRDGHRRTARQTPREGLRLSQQLVRRDDPPDETDPQRLIGQDGSPTMASSAARVGPTSRGRVQVIPESGARPIRPKASTNLASAAAIRRSQANAMEAPAPAATPLTAAMTGCGIERMARTIG